MTDFTEKIVAQNASDSRLRKHLYLRGNHQQDMFHDKVDKVNVWNRLWLSAKTTGVEILSTILLDNHLHLTVQLRYEGQDTDFMHHFRLSITQYYNRRYALKGMLGTRKFGRGTLSDTEDLKDCICYHIRNVVHHGISYNYLDYPFSTARYAFGMFSRKQRGYYTSETLPDNIAHAYLPAREKLPEGWTVTSEGLIVPPERIFRADIVEELFGWSREKYLESLTHRTTRENNDEDEPCAKRESLAYCAKSTGMYTKTTTIANSLLLEYTEALFDAMDDSIMPAGGLLREGDDELIDSHLFNLTQAEIVVEPLNNYLQDEISLGRCFWDFSMQKRSALSL